MSGIRHVQPVLILLVDVGGSHFGKMVRHYQLLVIVSCNPCSSVCVDQQVYIWQCIYRSIAPLYIVWVVAGGSNKNADPFRKDNRMGIEGT